MTLIINKLNQEKENIVTMTYENKYYWMLNNSGNWIEIGQSLFEILNKK